MQIILKLFSVIAVLFLIVWLGSDLLIISNYFNPSPLSFITFNVACCAVFFYLAFVIQKQLVLFVQVISAANSISNPATAVKANEKANEYIVTLKAEAIKFERIQSMLRDIKAAESIFLLDDNTQRAEAAKQWYNAVNEAYKNITATDLTK